MLNTHWLRSLRNHCRKQRRTGRQARFQNSPHSVVCSALKAEVLEDRCLLAAFGFDFDAIASDLHFTLRAFGSSDPGDAPHTQLRYGLGTINSLTGFPNLEAVGIGASDLTFQFGSDVAASNTVALSLDDASFDDGTGDGIVNQFYVPGSGTDNTLTVFNKVVPAATGNLLSLEIRTDTSPDSTGIGTFVLTSAVGVDTTIFDEINAVTEGTGMVDFSLGTFSYHGDPFGVGDAERFASNGNAAFNAATIGLVGAGPFALAVEGGDYVVRDQGNANAEVDRVATVSVSDLYINGSAASDTLSVDFSGGAFGIHFNGGVGSDALTINGGSFTTVTYNTIAPTAGSINYDGTIVGFAGVEPIIDNSSATDRVFTGSSADNVTLGDDGITGNNISRLSSTSTNESIDFVNPTNSLTVNGSAGNDTITLNGLDSLFDASVTLNGHGGHDDTTVTMADISSLTGLSFNGGAGNDCADIQAVTAMTGIPLISAEGGSGDDTVVVSAGDDADNGSLDDFFLFLNDSNKAKLDVGNLDVGFKDPLFESGDTSGANTIIINGSTDEDILVVDFMGGNPIPDGGVFFNGGSGANPDEIELENSSSITAITYSFTNANDGSIDLDGSTITFTGLELPIDYGDAPDTGAGTGGGNYQTLQSDTGPGHTIVTGLFLGATVDGDDGTLQNATANADDVDGVLPDNEPDDEDGVLSPLDLLGTIGAAPTITLLATNRSSNVATLSGWIDYNNDGVFDNATERAQVTVPAGTTDDRFTLTFPSIPTDTAGATYARFRLSTDAAAANSTGAASDGEVEDHVFSITTASDSTVDHFLKIASDTNGGPTLDDGVEFGSAVASIGDLDGDGVTDLAVGAYDDTTGGTSRGAVHVLFMNNDGSVKSSTKIASDTNGGPTLADFGGFGGRSGR
ncbi:MAG TPA: hypothetical protein EYG03_16040 [Planctomycetes bacterium]|nr:hypothetical protein [Planctomycetota bacterium]